MEPAAPLGAHPHSTADQQAANRHQPQQPWTQPPDLVSRTIDAGRSGAQMLQLELEGEAIHGAFGDQRLLALVQVSVSLPSSHARSFLNSFNVAENGDQFFSLTRRRQDAVNAAAR